PSQPFFPLLYSIPREPDVRALHSFPTRRSSDLFGISGPAVLRCSQFVVKELRKRKKVKIELDILPSIHHDAFYRELTAYIQKHPKRSVKNMLKDLVDVPERFILFLLAKHDVDEGMNIANVSKDF